MSMKILSPAGDFESLKMAISYGADEVYLGVKDFNARNIEGFNMSNLKQAVDYAHVFDVKVLLAVNILFSDDELQKALDLIVDACNIGVDAFIIQDLGLATLIKKHYNEIEIHASTQMGIHNLEGVKSIEKLGFKRVVLSRETPLSEIKRIKDNSNIEIEYFVQGALCVSFSGNCYLSSYLNDASGNRGKCKQLCRLPYEFEYNGKTLKKGYLLSAKDFNMLNRLKDLNQAGVDVIKIEGRARRPYYVAVATNTYRKALDEIENCCNDLELAFNREYTEGYFNGNQDIISKYPAHIGVKTGKVEKVTYGKKFNKITISSNQNISKKSTLKFFNKENEVAIISAYDIKKIADNKFEITSTQNLKGGEDVNIILDNQKEEAILNKIVKKDISIEIVAKENESIKAKFQHLGKTYLIEGENLIKAINAPLTKEEIIKNFSKSELFNAKLKIQLEKVFIPKQKINEFRRNVFEKIYNIITEKFMKNFQKIKINIKKSIKKFENFKFFEKLPINLSNVKNKNIIYSPEIYDLNDINNFIKKCREFKKSPYLDLPNFALKEDIILLNEIVEKTKIPIIANNYYALNFDTEIIIGGGLNVYNHATAEFYNKPIITSESEISTRINFPFMTLRHCPIKSNLNSNCANCLYKDGYNYIMQNGKNLKLKRKKLSTCTFYLTE